MPKLKILTSRQYPDSSSGPPKIMWSLLFCKRGEQQRKRSGQQPRLLMLLGTFAIIVFLWIYIQSMAEDDSDDDLVIAIRSSSSSTSNSLVMAGTTATRTEAATITKEEQEKSKQQQQPPRNPEPSSQELSSSSLSSSSLLTPKSGPPFKAAAAMLVGLNWTIERNTRKCWFNKSMDALQEYWHPTNPYPVILQRDFPWTETEKVAIRQKWPRLEFQFTDITEYYLKPQPPTKMKDGREGPKWVSYKRMCIYKSYGFLETPAIRPLDYVMLIDDDSCFLEPVALDVFREMHQHNIAYAYKSLMMEFPNYVVGLDRFVDQYVVQHRNGTMANPSLRAALTHKYGSRNKYQVFATNLEWINLQRYRQPDITNFFKAIEASQQIFHQRWGDAPLRAVLAYLFWHSREVMHLCGVAYQHGKRSPVPRRHPCVPGQYINENATQYLAQACQKSQCG